jgi:hypothetical protein
MLRQLSEQMRALGQIQPSEELLRLTEQYDDLAKASVLQQNKLSQVICVLYV